VLVGAHGSASSLLALERAVAIARERGWDLEIVTAWPDADEEMIRDVPGRYIVARGRALESQEAQLAGLDPDLASRVTTFLMNARPADVLIGRSEEADLLVVGAGRPDREGDRPGVGAECLDMAACPVLVVPLPEPAASTESDHSHRSRSDHRLSRKSRASVNA
jgi:nucleotide-binding universal stress UspA family protein